MKTPEEITQHVLDGMIGIGGCPSNEEFYAEFNGRLKRALSIADVGSTEGELCRYCKSPNILDGDVWTVKIVVSFI